MQSMKSFFLNLTERNASSINHLGIIIAKFHDALFNFI
jgi:hypothetical protein